MKFILSEYNNSEVMYVMFYGSVISYSGVIALSMIYSVLTNNIKSHETYTEYI